MNGLEKITQRITAEAEAEASATIAAAQGRCEDIKAKYDALAQEAYWKLIKDGGRELEQQVGRIGTSAAMEAKKSVLSMKQSYVDKALEKSLDAVRELPPERYIAFLSLLAANAVVTGTEELVFSSADKTAYGEAVRKAANELLKKRGVKAELTVADDTGSFKGGLIVRRGHVDANCTVETLIEMKRVDLAPEIASILFDE